MLQTQTIDPSTLSLLRKLLATPPMGNYSLAGGTALALQIGHRISVDLDFFGNSKTSLEEIKMAIYEQGDSKLLSQSKAILTLSVNDVKVDIVNYPYPRIENDLIVEDIRMHSLEDISAMKLAAICNRGRKRDFFDLYFLLKKFTLREMLQFHNSKFSDGSEFLVLKSLVYFTDAEEDEMPILLSKTSWKEVQSKIVNAVEKL